MKVVLASASPRRQQLLKEIFEHFDIKSPDIDEQIEFKAPSKTVCSLAKLKAEAVAVDEALVIAADTLVWKGKFYGKPSNAVAARQMLEELSGKAHYVYTGVCLKTQDKIRVFYDKAKVYLNQLDADFISQYIKSQSPLDKAGAYGIQDDGLVKSYKGDYSTIVGLPIKKLKKELAAFLR